MDNEPLSEWELKQFVTDVTECLASPPKECESKFLQYLDDQYWVRTLEDIDEFEQDVLPRLPKIAPRDVVAQVKRLLTRVKSFLKKQRSKFVFRDMDLKQTLNFIRDLEGFYQDGDYSGTLDMLQYDFNVTTGKQLDEFLDELLPFAKKVHPETPSILKEFFMNLRKDLITGAKTQRAREKAFKTDKDKKFFEVLTELFTSYVYPDDMPYVQYRPYKNYVKLQDADGHLGNMDATTSNSSIESFMKQNGLKPDVKAFIDFLERRGAQLLGRAKRPKYYPPLYD